MKVNRTATQPPARVPQTPSPQLQVRSGLRLGAASGCELGIQYWRKELNYWRQKAQDLGCA